MKEQPCGTQHGSILAFKRYRRIENLPLFEVGKRIVLGSVKKPYLHDKRFLLPSELNEIYVRNYMHRPTD